MQLCARREKPKADDPVSQMQGHRHRYSVRSMWGKWMGQDYEFVVRHMRGKGIQIVPLAARRDRFFWFSLGVMACTSWVALMFHELPPERAFQISYGLMGAVSGYQVAHLWRLHREMKAMLKEAGMTEKQVLATIDAIIKKVEDEKAKIAEKQE
jgi:hypothetical protein